MDLDTTPYLDCAGRRLRLDRPSIMGVLNLTPDSFSDGGSYDSVDAAVSAGLRMIDDGAHIIDVGGESTRPGSEPVDDSEELRRVLPVIEKLAAASSVPISIDTSKPAVMRAAIEAGAGMVNDVRALTAEGALEAVAASNTALCLMHMQGMPASMQHSPDYAEVVSEVQRFLVDRILAAEFAGIARKRIVLDPGFGFGKRLEHNLALLAQLERFAELECPLLVGLSRKSMLGAITGQEDPARRLSASVVAAVIAVQHGAQIVRVHDVAATADALAVWSAVSPLIRPKQAPKSSGPSLADLFDDD